MDKVPLPFEKSLYAGFLESTLFLKHQHINNQHINTEISEIVVVINHWNEMTFNTNKPFLGMP
jgi:hypothetical protein